MKTARHTVALLHFTLVSAVSVLATLMMSSVGIGSRMTKTVCDGWSLGKPSLTEINCSSCSGTGGTCPPPLGPKQNKRNTPPFEKNEWSLSE